MPSRWLSLSIVAFWLATMGWLFWNELWPNWRPGEPPPFHIDLVEEVQKGDTLRAFWTVQRQSKGDILAQDVLTATTWVDYLKQNDNFVLHARFTPIKQSEAPSYLVGLIKITMKSMTSEYRVDHAGRLRELRAEVNVSVSEPSGENAVPLQLDVWAEVRGEQILAHCRGNAAAMDKRVQIDLPPSAVSHNGSVVMPLHPVNRIHGLRPGQSWRQPLIDPFRDAFALVPGFSGGVRHVNARVLPQPQVLKLNDAETTCLVIEYESEGEIVGRTWVEQDSERVQQQEAIFNGDTWIMKRDNPYKLRSRQKGISLRQPRNEP